MNEPSETAADSGERSTGELIEVLGEDIDSCFEAVMQTINNGERLEDGGITAAAGYDFHARQFIRAVFAFLEGTSFVVRMWAVAHLMQKDDISDEERWLAVEKRFDLDDAGHIVKKPAKITLFRNLKFTFALLDRLHGLTPQLDTSKEWWSCLQRSTRVRDRLMHPRLPEDLDVSVEEVIEASKAEVGFRLLIDSYPKSDLPSLE